MLGILLRAINQSSQHVTLSLTGLRPTNSAACAAAAVEYEGRLLCRRQWPAHIAVCAAAATSPHGFMTSRACYDFACSLLIYTFLLQLLPSQRCSVRCSASPRRQTLTSARAYNPVFAASDFRVELVATLTSARAIYSSG